MSEWEQVGVIGVDAGLCWVGDPCYILHKDGDKQPQDIGENWVEFCNKLDQDDDVNPVAHQFNYDLGHPGLGVCVETGYGDGVYPVEIRKNSQGRVAEVRIIFISDDEE